MTIGSKEHGDIISSFERNFPGERFDKEEKGLWKKGQVYQSGMVNKMYKAYILGYSAGRVEYIN